MLCSDKQYISQNPPKMKNGIQITFFVLAFIALTLTSCQKDILTDTPIQASPEVSNPFLTAQVEGWKADVNAILANNISIELDVTPCATSGVNVTVTSPDVDLSDGEHTLNWYRNTEQTIYSNDQTLECVCQFGVRLEVINMLGEVVAEASIDLPSC